MATVFRETINQPRFFEIGLTQGTVVVNHNHHVFESRTTIQVSRNDASHSTNF